jgi:hypothetical protein
LTVQNENQTPVATPKKFLGQLVCGVLLLGLGIVLFREANLARTERSWIGLRFEALIFASPLLLLLGAVMLFVGLFRFIRRFVIVGPLVSAEQASRFEKAWRVCVWVVTVATVYPWWWLDILTRSNGERPSNEGEGMGGSLIMMFFGMPAFALAIFNEARLRRNRHIKK